MLCPGCGRDNIPGVDTCEDCGSDLAGLDLPSAGSGFRGRMLNDRVEELVSEAVTVPPDATVAEAVETMRSRGVGCVLVVEGGRLMGLFNERHLLGGVLNRGRDPKATSVSEVMSSELLLLDPEDPPAFAVHRMVSHDRRHLPVVSGSEIHGYVSVREVLGYIRSQLVG